METHQQFKLLHQCYNFEIQKALITSDNGHRLVLQHYFYFRVTTAFPVVVLYMYYTDKPNIFPQQKLEIPYNILFMLKTSIYTLFKVNIEFFISSNCQKKE